jgi:hypothetical protein
MNQTRKDIFGNTYTIPTNSRVYKPMSFEQKLREAKARDKYKAYQFLQRQKQVENIKRVAQRSNDGIKKTGGFLKKLVSRATSKRLSTPKEKISGSIYKKE